MKKLVLAAIALVSFTTATAQDGLKGTWFVAGQVAFSSEEEGDSKSSTNTFLPIVGTFLTSDVALGLGIGSMNTKSEVGNLTTNETSTFVVKPLVRKYWNVKGGFYLFGQAAVPFMAGKDKLTEEKTSSFALELAPGFDYIVNKWMTVETSFDIFSIGTSSIKPKTGDKTSSFDINANPMNTVSDRGFGGLRVGVKFLF